MPSTVLLPQPRFVAYDTDGSPLAGGTLATYVAGTTTPKQTWQDAGGATLNTNPIVLDSAGSCLLYGVGGYSLAAFAVDGTAIPAYSGQVFETANAEGALYGQDYGIAASNADNSLALQQFFNAVLAAGTTGYLPAGTLNYSTGLLINTSANSALFGNRITIIGMGQGNTVLNFTGSSGTALYYEGSVTGSGIDGFFKFEKFSFQGTSLSNPTVGLEISQCAHFGVQDMTIQGFGQGLDLIDCLSCYFQGMSLTFNTIGGTAAFQSFSEPNAISFIQCEIGNNLNIGFTLVDAATVNFIGGAIEGNGFAGTAATRYGVFVNNGSGTLQGSCSANFYGVYCEANGGIADIWFAAGTAAGPCTLNVDGCTLNKISPTVYVTNHIRMDLGGSNLAVAKLIMKGNGFASYNGYTPSASRQSVVVNTGGATLWEVVDLGNLYNDAVEAPTIPGPVTNKLAMAFAFCSFNGSLTTPVVIQGHNVASITKSTTGTYTIGFTQPCQAGNFAWVGQLNSTGFCATTAAVTGGLSLVTYNPAGVATDYTLVSVVVFAQQVVL